MKDTRRAHGARCDGNDRCSSCEAADRAGDAREAADRARRGGRR